MWLCTAVAAHASSIVSIESDSANSTSGLGTFTGSVEYFDLTSTLVVTLTNTSNAANGGYITGFLFNIASSDPNASASLLDSPAPTHPFENCSGNGLNGQPFGNPFSAGAALGGDFLGGESPVDGIAVGQTGAFSFHVNAADASFLSAMNFLTGGPYDFNFLVRFRGFEDGGSDKVPVHTNFVPLPPALPLGATGLVLAVIGSWRMRRKHTSV
jgi:hypothetical protein